MVTNRQFLISMAMGLIGPMSIHTLTAAPGMNDQEGGEEEEDEQDSRRKEEKPPDRSGGGWPGGSGGGGGGDSSSGSLCVSRESSGSESNVPLKRGRGRPPRKRPLEGTCVHIYVP